MAERRPNRRLLKRFGERLRALRKLGGYTQQALGSRADLDWKYVGAIERAERNPSLDVIDRLARALGVEIEQLFYFDDAGTVPEHQVAERQVLYALGKARGSDKRMLRDIVARLLQWAKERGES